MRAASTSRAGLGSQAAEMTLKCSDFEQAVGPVEDGPHGLLVVVADQNQQYPGRAPLQQPAGEQCPGSGQVHGVGSDLAGRPAPQGLVAVNGDHLGHGPQHRAYDVGQAQGHRRLEGHGKGEVGEALGALVEALRHGVVACPVVGAQYRDAGRVG